MSDEKKQNTHIARRDLDYVSDSKTAVLQESPRFAWISLFLILLVLIVAFLWASIAQVPVQTIADGKVVPSAKLQLVQNFEGGIVSKVFVRAGDMVKKGQVLVQLSKTRFSSAYQEELTKLTVLRARQARLQAEANGKKKIIFPKDILGEHPKVIQSEQYLFNARQDLLNEKLKFLNQALKISQRELNIVAPLVRKGVMSKLDKLRLEKELNNIQGQIREKASQARSDARHELNKTRAEISVLMKTITASKDRMARTVVRSPVNGIVNKVYVNTIGQVVKPGEKMIEVVPLDKQLTIEAKIRPGDIGFVHPKQRAIVKISAYDATIYGSLDATVVNISADTVTDEKGNTYYEVFLKTDENRLGTKNRPLPIIPGMTVTVHIITGKKSVLTYIMKPFLRAKSQALRER